MSTSHDISDLPRTGSTYPATKSDAITFSNSSSTPQSATTTDQANTTHNHHTSIPAQPTNYSTESDPLNSHHRPSLSTAPGEDGAAAGVEGLSGDTTIRRASAAQNAPGKLGARGENLLGAVGFGGAEVERPQGEQGLGEKIVNFLGA